MKSWEFLDGKNAVYVYDSGAKLVYANDIGRKSRGIKLNMIGTSLEDIYGDCSGLRRNIDIMINKSSSLNIEMELTDIRGLKHEVTCNFHAFYFNKRRYIIEETVKAESDFFKIKRDRFQERKRVLFDFEDIITCNEEMLKVKKRGYEASKSVSNVLIFGETGTGKELLVQAIHKNSHRGKEAFVAQNCSAVPKGLFESIFFGTEKGGYTGSEQRKGIFEMANRGTLYLDELNSMPLEVQAKILRVIQEKKVRRVGSNKEIDIDVRVIASVNETFEDILRNRKIRSDLFFRLNVISLEIPPLRERREDVPKLITKFICEFNERFHSDISGVEDECMKAFLEHDWPGNIRELRNLMEGIFNIKDEGPISKGDVGDRIQFKDKSMGLSEKVQKYESNLIREALKINNDNVSRTAEYLGIPRQTLQSKLKKI